MSTFAANMKVFHQQKIYFSERMYGGKYDVNYAMELLFDDEFGLSGSEISEKESKDNYCC